MPKTSQKLFNNFLGLDLRSTDTNRDDNYATSMTNCQIRKSGGLEKKKGSQARSVSQGGHGKFTYNKIDQDTGAITQEEIVVDDRLWRRKEAIFTITYTGGSSVTVDLFGDSTNSAVFMTITEAETEVLNENLGKGFDESSPVTLAALKTAVDLVSGFSVAITGTTTIPAAFLKFKNNYLMDVDNTTLAIKAYEWEEVNRTVTSGPFAGSETNKDDSDFENVSGVNLNGVLYLGNGYDESQKYDGQTLYRIGCPKPTIPTLVLTDSGGGVAEVTDITTRAADGVAQIVDVECIAETSTQRQVTLKFDEADTGSAEDYNPSNPLTWRSFALSTTTEGIGCWFSVTDLGSSHQDRPVFLWFPDRYFQIDILSTDDRDAIALKVKNKIDADPDFSAVIGAQDNWVVVTNTDYGGNVGVGWWSMGGLLTRIVNDAGYSGLHQSYFQLKDEDGSVAFWFDIHGGGIEPSHGADRSVEITTVSQGDVANDVASAVSTAVNADSKFGTSVSTDTVTVTNSSATAVGEDVSAGDSNFTVAVTTSGLDSIDGTYFIISDGFDPDTDGLAFWFDVDNSGTGEPAHGQAFSVQILSVNTGMTADQVAGEVQTAVNAQSSFSASVSTNVVTVTAASAGNWSDPSAGTSGFTVETTTQGETPGLGGGTWRYRLVVKQKDKAGNIIIGEPNDFNSSGTDPEITLAVSTENVLLTMTGVQAESGFNTDCAIVDGAQTDANTITVASGHTHRAGNVAYFLDRKTQRNYVERNITAIAATTITVDGDAVDVNDLDVISNNLRFQINRTLDGGTTPFLVEEIPNDSINGNFTFIDTILDADLGAEFQEPILPHSLPPKGRYLASWNGILLSAGNPEAVNTLSFSYIAEDGNTSEYFPTVNSFQIQTDYGDKISGLCPNNEVFLVLKDRSVHVVSGDPQTGNIRVDSATSGEHGCSSHNSIQEVNGACVFLDKDGVYAVSGGQLPVEVSKPIRPLFTDDQGFSAGTYAFKRAVGFNDRVNDRYILFIPVETTSPKECVYATSESKVLVWDYYRNAWFEWNGVNMAGGITKVDDDIVFNERKYSTTTLGVDHVNYQFNNSNTLYDYMDHVTAISTTYKSNWFTMGEPSYFKKWTRLKMFNTEAVTPTGFNLTVKTETNYIPNTFSTNHLVNFDIATNKQYQLKLRLKPTKARSMRYTFLNSEDNINWSLSGYEVETALIQRATDMKE